jgi:hypothetical protein
MTRGAGVQEDESSSAASPLSRGEAFFWYGAAGVTYVGASIVEKGLLNWFVGPLWLVAFIWLGPMVTRRARKIGRRG